MRMVPGVYNLEREALGRSADFEREFLSYGKKVEVSFTLKSEFEEKDGIEVIKSLELRIVKATVDGVELPKRTRQDEL